MNLEQQRYIHTFGYVCNTVKKTTVLFSYLKGIDFKRKVCFMAPPVQRMDDFMPGDFSFISDNLHREALTHDYQVIESNFAWKVLKNHNPDNSFMWHTHGAIWDNIRIKMWNGHSGASMSLSLRTLEIIAKQGWENYVFLTRP